MAGTQEASAQKNPTASRLAASAYSTEADRQYRSRLVLLLPSAVGWNGPLHFARARGRGLLNPVGVWLWQRMCASPPNPVAHHGEPGPGKTEPAGVRSRFASGLDRTARAHVKARRYVWFRFDSVRFCATGRDGSHGCGPGIGRWQPDRGGDATRAGRTWPSQLTARRTNRHQSCAADACGPWPWADRADRTHGFDGNVAPPFRRSLAVSLLASFLVRAD